MTYTYFNPRSHTGSDAIAAGAMVVTNQFQSTLPHGERQRGGEPMAHTSVFQSTLPHGERQDGHRGFTDCDNFNPRSHTGSDVKVLRLYVLYLVFQSTLPHGERRLWLLITHRFFYFNPRSHTGSDVSYTDPDSKETIISIHAPTRGATRRLQCFAFIFQFQSTLPHGERRGGV